jgi:hypothetical protein
MIYGKGMDTMAQVSLQKSLLEEFSKVHSLLLEEGLLVHLATHEQFHGFSFGGGEPVDHLPGSSTPKQTSIGTQNKLLDNLYRGHWPWTSGGHQFILDKAHKIAYVALGPSNAGDGPDMRQWEERQGYHIVPMHPNDAQQNPIFLTSSVLSLGTTLAVVCVDAITNLKEKVKVLNSLHATSKEILVISMEQMQQFCGDVMEVCSRDGTQTAMIMSATAYAAFTAEQIELILRHVNKVTKLEIPSIESVGRGTSIRSILAEF